MDCPNSHGPMIAGRKSWVCEECDCRVPRESRAAPAVSPTVEQLPSVLAIPLSEYLAESHPVMRLHRLCDAAEILVRFLAVVALGEVRRALGAEPLPDQLLKALQPSIERPTFGQWRDMLAALTEALAGRPDLVVPELPPLVTADLLPALQGPSEGGNLVLLRNQLAHGGGMTRATAEAYLAEWEPRFALLVERLALLQECDLCCVLGAEPQRLRGPALATSPCEVNDVLRAELAKVGSHVVLLRGGRALDLWPLCDYGRARSTTLQGAREAEADSPLVYFRSERDRLLYAALGVDLPHGERRDVLEEFRNLFRLEDRVRPEPGFVSDFEAEIRADAAALVGRVGDVAQAKAAIKAAQSGVLWITGPGGIGKSFLVAKLADDLGNAPQSICRIAWRFKVGDAARCSRVPFFRHAVERLAAWLQKPDVAPAQDPNELEGQLAELLDEVGDLTAEDPRGRPPRVLFVLDGLDEIQRLDPGFPELPFHLTRPNVVWLCAGRAERNLPQVFAKNRCTHVFPDGLPAMTRDDVRALLLEEVGSRKYDLLALDHEAGDEVANEALQAIVDRAEGLPLYVRYVVQDILSGHFRFADLGARLPSSLSAYYDDLLRRMSIGELQALLTPLVVTIAHAPAPLNEDTLHLLMTRRQVVRGTDKGRETLRQGLQAAQSMLRAAPAEGGTLGFEPYHPTFREHILTDATGLIGDQNEFAQDSLRDLATGWRALPQDQTSRAYALRFGPRILTQAERWDDLTILLTDLEFVEAKCEAGMTYDLVADYNAALSSVPAGRLSRAVEPFHRFVRANAHIFAQGLEWVIQRAYNSAQSGPVAEQAERLLNDPRREKRPWLRRLNRPDPSPCAATLVGHAGRATALTVAPDGSRLVSGDKDGSVRVWDATTGVCVLTLEGHAAKVTSAAAMWNENWAVTGSEDGTVRVWDLLTGECRRIVDGHAGGPIVLTPSAHGHRLVADNARGAVRLWDLETGVCVQVLRGYGGHMTAAAVTPDGSYLVTGDGRGAVAVWDTGTGDCCRWLSRGGKGVMSLAAGSAGGSVTALRLDTSVDVWDSSTGALIRTVRLTPGSILKGTVAADGLHAITGFADTPRLMPTAPPAESPTETSKADDAPPPVRWECEAKVWDLCSGACTHHLGGHDFGVFAVAIAPDGQWAATGGTDPTVRVWDLSGGPQESRGRAHDGRVTGVAVTPDAGLALTTSYDLTGKLWDPATGECLHTLVGHTSFARSAALTPDGAVAATGGEDGRVIAWRGEPPLPVGQMKAGEIDALVMAPGGSGVWVCLDWWHGEVGFWGFSAEAQRLTLAHPGGAWEPWRPRLGAAPSSPAAAMDRCVCGVPRRASVCGSSTAMASR